MTSRSRTRQREAFRRGEAAVEGQHELRRGSAGICHFRALQARRLRRRADQTKGGQNGD